MISCTFFDRVGGKAVRDSFRRPVGYESESIEAG